VVGDRTGQGGFLCPGEYFTPTILHYAIALAMKAAACDDPSGSTTTPQNDAAQQASAELRANVDAELSTIEPLAVPLAPEAIVVLPTRDQLLHRVKAEAPSGTEDAALVSSVNLLSYYTISWQVLIKGASKNALMSPNWGIGRHPASGFWHSVAPERLMRCRNS
jgi:hypothetical protein